METTFIYALNDPETGVCRYVGKSDNPKVRLYNHLAETRNERHRRARWIQSLTARGLKPALEILDEVSKTEWPMWEVAYIAYFIEQGCDLVNGNAGGEGSTNPSPETLKRMSDSHKGLLAGAKHPMFGKTGAAHPAFGKPSPLRGIPHTPEVVARIVAWHSGKKRGPSARARMRVKKENSSSKFHGVCYSKRDKKWAANISALDKKLFLGYFLEESEAAKAHDAAAKIHHGAHAVLNFP